MKPLAGLYPGGLRGTDLVRAVILAKVWDSDEPPRETLRIALVKAAGASSNDRSGTTLSQQGCIEAGIRG
jgi:hypothetical protein